VEETPIFDLPFPEETDPPDGAAQIQSLAERVEVLLTTIEQLVLGAPAPGNIIVVNGTSDPVYKAITGDVTNNSAGVFTIGGEKVATTMVKNLAITAAKLAENAVETAKINNLAVTEEKLAALAVTAIKLAAEAVETGKIKNLAVTEAKLAAEAVTTGKIAENAITSAKVGDLGLGNIWMPRYLGAIASEATAIKSTYHILTQIGQQVTLTGLSFYIGAAAAGEVHKVFVAIYSNAKPRVQLAASLETVVSNVENTFVQVPFTAALKVNPGRYWLSLISNGAVNVQGARTIESHSKTLGGSFALSVPSEEPNQALSTQPVVATY
jgi:hypothetical protein